MDNPAPRFITLFSVSAVHASEATSMLGKDRKRQLYRGYHAAGWTPKAEGWKVSSAKVTFSNFDALMADPRASAAALSDAADAIATSIAGDLHK